MYDEEKSKKILQAMVQEFEELEMANDLDIKERLFIIARLLENAINSIEPYMIETEQDKRDMKNLKNVLKILKKLGCF